MTNVDPAAYTLIGALGGVALTQLANYLLEDRRIENRRKDEESAHYRVVSKELNSKRQEAYALFMADLDYWYVLDQNDRMQHLLINFYSAAIIASDDVSVKMSAIVEKAQLRDTKNEEMRSLKKALMISMRKDPNGFI
jgi:hypothetical protein